jgi:hypothetical protein
MEALLEREGKVDSWNDERLDELSRRMDAGFSEMREGFSRIEHEVKEGFAAVATREDVQVLDNRIFKLMIMMLVFCGGQVTALLAAFLTITGS